MSELFYLQDKRTFCGNSMMWWAINDNGYTCDLRCAKVWTSDELIERGFWVQSHPKYKVWAKELCDRLVQHHVDIQDLTFKDDSDEYAQVPHTMARYFPSQSPNPQKASE